MFTEHLARYVDKDTTNRGKAGYWAAAILSVPGKLPEACALYEGVIYRYAANWYGYLAAEACGDVVPSGAKNLESAACESDRKFEVGHRCCRNSTAKEMERVAKSDQLSTIGLFDWAIDELQEAKKTAANHRR